MSTAADNALRTALVTGAPSDAEAGRAIYAGANALQAEDMAQMIAWIAAQPAHVNINAIEVMPTTQSWAGFPIERRS